MSAPMDTAEVTGESITDEMIRELDAARAVDHDTIEDALEPRLHYLLRRDARARCAAIYNARLRTGAKP